MTHGEAAIAEAKKLDKQDACDHMGSFHPIATVQGITQSPYISVLQCFDCGILEKTTATVTLTRLAAPRRSVAQWVRSIWMWSDDGR